MKVEIIQKEEGKQQINLYGRLLIFGDALMHEAQITDIQKLLSQVATLYRIHQTCFRHFQAIEHILPDKKDRALFLSNLLTTDNDKKLWKINLEAILSNPGETQSKRRMALLRYSRSPTALDTLVRQVRGACPRLGRREQSSGYPGQVRLSWVSVCFN